MRQRRIIRQVHPQLPVADLDRAVAFHRRLGFDVEVYDGGGFAFVRDGGNEVWHLREVADLTGGKSRAGVFAHVRDPDAVRAQFVGHGLEPTEVATEAWGMREFSVTDPDGNLLRFGANTED